MTDFKPVPTNREVAERFGVCTRTVTRALKRDPRWWTNYRRDLQQKAVDLKATGMTWREVGEALGGVSEEAARAMGKRGIQARAEAQRQNDDERQPPLPL